MNRSSDCLALTMKDAAKLVGVDYRTIKLGMENGTIPSVQLGPRRMIPRAGSCCACSASRSNQRGARHAPRLAECARLPEDL